MECGQRHRHDEMQRKERQAQRQQTQRCDSHESERGQGGEEEEHDSEDREHDPYIPTGRKIYTPEVATWHATPDLTPRSPS